MHIRVAQYRSLVQRLLSALRENKLVNKEAGRYVLTEAGAKEAGTVAAQEELAHFELPRDVPPGQIGTARVASPAEIDELEPPRQQALQQTRRNFPVAEVLPSPDPPPGNAGR